MYKNKDTENAKEKETNRINLGQLLKDNPRASYYFDTLHPIVQHHLRQQSDKISTIEDLYAFANNAMTNVLKGIPSLFDDGNSWPD